MKHERIYLDPNNDRVFIDTYVANSRSRVRDAMLVIPGGGYSAVCTEREGEPIALAFFAKGMNCFVLNYRVTKDNRYPDQLIDASRAILYIKQHADELCINPDRVFTVGFSAGGHLSGSCAILHKDAKVLEALGIKKGDNKPRASVLGYPVVSAFGKTHLGSFEMLLGKPINEMTIEEKTALSLECNVDADSSPVFIWHTSRDLLVPIEGSLKLADAYYNVGTPVALHIYPYGDHGAALANEITECGKADYVQPLAECWVDEVARWIKTLE